MILLLANLLVVEAERGSALVQLGDSLWAEEADLRVSGDTVFARVTGSARITLPRGWGLAFSGDSGSITLVGSEGEAYPPWVKATSFAGDLYLKNPFPTRLEFSSVSGDFIASGEVLGGNWASALYEVRTVSGRVDVLAPVPCSLKVGTGTGAVRVELAEEPPRGWYLISTGSGAVELKTPNASIRLSGMPYSYENGEFRVRVEVPEAPGKGGWLSEEGFLKPKLVLDYNRVDGLLTGAGLSFGSVFQVWGAWRAGAGEPAGGAEASLKLVRKPDGGVWLGAYDSTAFWDPWAPDLLENFLGTLLFGEDGREYFGKEGLAGGLWLTTGKLSLRLGGFSERLYPLSSVPTLALFGPGLRENITFGELERKGFSARLTYRNPGVRAEAQAEFSDAAKRAWLLLDLARESWDWGAYLRLGAGWTDSDAEPFLFHLGGVYTVPGFREAERSGPAAYLVKVELARKLHHIAQSASVFVDAGDAFSGKTEPLVSAGLGVKFFGLSVRLSRAILGGERFAAYLRLARRP